MKAICCESLGVYLSVVLMESCLLNRKLNKHGKIIRSPCIGDSFGSTTHPQNAIPTISWNNLSFRNMLYTNKYVVGMVNPSSNLTLVLHIVTGGVDVHARYGHNFSKPVLS